MWRTPADDARVSGKSRSARSSTRSASSRRLRIPAPPRPSRARRRRTRPDSSSAAHSSRRWSSGPPRLEDVPTAPRPLRPVCSHRIDCTARWVILAVIHSVVPEHRVGRDVDEARTAGRRADGDLAGHDPVDTVGHAGSRSHASTSVAAAVWITTVAFVSAMSAAATPGCVRSATTGRTPDRSRNP